MSVHDSKIELPKARALIAQKYTASLMNDTKWAECVQLLHELKLSCRIKFIYRENVTDWGGVWSVNDIWMDGMVGPFMAIEIEWMEVNPIMEIPRGMLIPSEIIDRTDVLEKGLRSIGPFFHREGSLIRIIGHLRASGE